MTDPTSAHFLHTAATIKHKSDCPAADVVPRRGIHGDQLAQCRACGRFQIVPPPTPRTRYVCRDHHNPVSWRGHGCRECDPPKQRPPRTESTRRSMTHD